MTTVPLAEGLLTSVEEPQLVGSRCGDCGIVTFPRQDSCPRCGATTMVEHRLATRGRLWAWTTQSFPPPAPPYLGPTGKDFVPFGVGYVDLGDVKVEMRLTEADPERLRNGMELELTVITLRTDEEGNEVVIPAFRPVEETPS